MIIYNPKPDIIYLNNRITKLENRLALLEITLLNKGDKDEKSNSLPGPQKSEKRKPDSK